MDLRVGDFVRINDAVIDYVWVIRHVEDGMACIRNALGRLIVIDLSCLRRSGE